MQCQKEMLKEMPTGNVFLGCKLKNSQKCQHPTVWRQKNAVKSMPLHNQTTEWYTIPILQDHLCPTEPFVCTPRFNSHLVYLLQIIGVITNITAGHKWFCTTKEWPWSVWIFYGYRKLSWTKLKVHFCKIKVAGSKSKVASGSKHNVQVVTTTPYKEHLCKIKLLPV